MIVLWVILFIILGIIGLIALLLLLALILLTLPVRYSAQSHHTQFACAKVRYLFGLVTAKATYEEGKLHCTARIGWVNIYDRDSETTQPKKQDYAPAPSKMADTVQEAIARAKAPEVESATATQEQKPTISQRIESYKQKYNHIKTTANSIWTYPDRQKLTALAIKTLKRLWRALCPKHIRINATIGLSNPADTAYMMAAYAIAMEFLQLQEKVCITASFNEPAMQIDANVKGSISAMRLILPVLLLILQRPVRKLIKILLFKKGRKK